ncbi:hypothetical protein Bbelb_203120 [Branchiostoma belcheri]|nr:hypothetical protein Bbelb_203120 [Branchiostoma belcheri]
MRHGRAIQWQIPGSEEMDLDTFFRAVERGDVQTVRRGLDAGVDVRAKMTWRDWISKLYERTSLHVASEHGQTEVAALLIEHGADLEARTWSDRTSLHVASWHGQTEVAALLIEHGADLEARTSCEIDNVVASCGVVDRAFDAQARSPGFDSGSEHRGMSEHWKRTPLHQAAARGHSGTCELLIRHGADVRARDVLGLTPSDEVAYLFHKETRRVLKNREKEVIKEKLHSELLQKSGGLKTDRCKVSLFGQGKAGKSTLKISFRRGWVSAHLQGWTYTSSAEEPHDPTPGVDVGTFHIPGVGEVSLWDFAGQSEYAVTHSMFMDAENTISIVLYNIMDDTKEQDVHRWLSFIKSCNPNRQRDVILVASHADKVSPTSGQRQAAHILQVMKAEFKDHLRISDEVFLMNCKKTRTPEMDRLKKLLAKLKKAMLEHQRQMPKLCAEITKRLPSWCQTKCSPKCPVLRWPGYVDAVKEIDPHLDEEFLLKSTRFLDHLGEVIFTCPKSSESDPIIVLKPNWLCTDVFGPMMAPVNFPIPRLERTSDDYVTREEIQRVFQDVADVDLLITLLQEFQLCHSYDGQTFIFPGLLKQTIPGQSRLMREQENRPLLWRDGAKCVDRNVEGLIKLSPDGRAANICVRSAKGDKVQCGKMLQQLENIIADVLDECSPGTGTVEKVLSARALKEHREELYSYSKEEISKAAAEGGTIVHPTLGFTEQVSDLLYVETPLTRNRPELVQVLRHVEPILDRLLARGILGDDEPDRIRAKETPQDKARELLDIVGRKGERARREFTALLEKMAPVLCCVKKTTRSSGTGQSWSGPESRTRPRMTNTLHMEAVLMLHMEAALMLHMEAALMPYMEAVLMLHMEAALMPYMEAALKLHMEAALMLHMEAALMPNMEAALMPYMEAVLMLHMEAALMPYMEAALMLHMEAALKLHMEAALMLHMEAALMLHMEAALMLHMEAALMLHMEAALMVHMEAALMLHMEAALMPYMEAALMPYMEAALMLHMEAALMPYMEAALMPYMEAVLMLHMEAALMPYMEAALMLHMEAALMPYMEAALMLHMEAALMPYMEAALMLHMEAALMLHMEAALMLHMEAALMLHMEAALMLHMEAALMVHMEAALMLHMEAALMPYMEAALMPYMEAALMLHMEAALMPYMEAALMPYMEAVLMLHMEAALMPYMEAALMLHMEAALMPYMEAALMLHMEAALMPYMEAALMLHMEAALMPYMEAALMPYMEAALMLHMEAALMLHMEAALMLYMEAALMPYMEAALMLHMEAELMLDMEAALMLHMEAALMPYMEAALMLHMEAELMLDMEAALMLHMEAALMPYMEAALMLHMEAALMLHMEAALMLPMEAALMPYMEAVLMLHMEAALMLYLERRVWNFQGGVSTVNCQAGQTLGGKAVVYATVLQLNVPKEDQEAADRDGIILIRPDPSGLTTAPNLDWLTHYHLHHYPNLPQDVTCIIGHADITDTAARNIKDKRYPQADLMTFTHVIPEDTEYYKGGRKAMKAREKERDMLDKVDSAKAAFSVGKQIFDHFSTKYKGRKKPQSHHKFLPKPSKIFLDADVKPGGEQKVVLSIGRVRKVEKLKGHDLTARALGEVVEVIRNVRWDVRGISELEHEYDISKKILEDALNSGKLKPNLMPYGTQEDIRDDMEIAHLVLMPSRSEPFGLVGLEAIAAGIPVLISNQTGLAEMITDLIDEGKLSAEHRNVIVETSVNDRHVAADVERWAKRIVDVLEHSDSEFEKAARFKRELVESRYWEESHNAFLQACGVLSEADPRAAGTPQDGAHALLDTVGRKEGDALPVFQSVLREVDSRTADMLMATQRPDEPQDRADEPQDRADQLTRHRPELVQALRHLEPLLAPLQAMEVLSTEECDVIRALTTSQDRACALLDAVGTKGGDARQVFKVVLEEVNPEAAEMLP